MDLDTIGNVSSIIGLVITIITLLLSANVNRKVNTMLKVKADRTYFNKKVKNVIDDLKKLLDIAEKSEYDVLLSTKQYSTINSAICVVSSSWDALFQYENRLSKKRKIKSWNKKFESIRNMYNNNTSDSNEVISFLSEFITFLEKENDNNE